MPVWQVEHLGEHEVYFSKSITNTNIEENDNTHPISFILLANYHNPFNQSTTISYNPTNDEQVEINIYNIQGQLVKTLDFGQKSSGKHIVYWDRKDDQSNNVKIGIYFCYLKTGEKNRKVVKMTFIK
ncbi:MAG: FlgD immunoglobulin-like domain containing protein [Bacteroidales bacterium]